ncbi:GTPase IMAP family member 9-like [Conger conger]|uniref:GTPase IMAP family member 9-like n=1 Tax=Conger conger TaxID=82655 RepID=UPI002A5A6772|nr:GTPase IMAP family member 9-like [Conger conger]
MEGSVERRIVLLGKTGAGKSSAANAILGEKLFKTSCSPNPDTFISEGRKMTVDGRKLTVIDTPGFFGFDSSDEDLKAEVMNCMVECFPGPHAFVIVLPMVKQTPEERNAVEVILKMFGEEALKYAVVLFTHGDQLEDSKTIQQFVDGCAHLTKLIKSCGNRVHVIDNKYWNDPKDGHDGNDKNNSVQIKKLLNTIDQMVIQNIGEYYTTEFLLAAAKALGEDWAAHTTTASGYLIKSFMKTALNYTAGITAQALWGTFLGAAFGFKFNLGTVLSPELQKWIAISVTLAKAIRAKVGGEEAQNAETYKEVLSGIIKRMEQVLANLAKCKDAK